MSCTQAYCVKYMGKLLFVSGRQAWRFDGCVEPVTIDLLSTRRFRISATKVWWMLFLCVATTVRDFAQEAGDGYHPIWCATQMHI
jgi:hypothetical protein